MCTCMQSLEILLFMYFCKEILHDWIYRNFIQGKTARTGVWLSLLPRSTHKDSKEIYFVFF
jgi:hypothetical protein